MDVRRPVGRQEIYTKDVFDEICAQIAIGESLRTITEQNSMPSRITFYRWLRLNPELCNQYEAARRDRADFFAEEMLGEARVADESQPGSVQKQRLIIDTMKWVASKHNPRNYGDSLNLKGNLEVKNTSPAEVWLDEILAKIDKNKQSEPI